MLTCKPEVLRRAQRPAFLRRDRRTQALRRARGPRSEALRLAQAVALEAVEALEALALMLSTLGLISMAHGAGALFSSAQDCPVLELMLGGQVVALEALKAQALTLSSTPGLISLALALVHSSAQDCQAVALDAPWLSC